MAEETHAENLKEQIETKPLLRKSKSEYPKGFWGKSKNFLTKILFVFILFVIVVFAFAFISTRGVSEIAGDVVAHLQAAECDEIFAITSETFREFTDAAKWDTECSRVAALLIGDATQTSLQIQTNTDGRDVSQANYRISDSGGNDYSVIMTFVDNDGWQLDAITSQSIENVPKIKTETKPEDTTESSPSPTN
jgi:hypothetical protein